MNASAAVPPDSSRGSASSGSSDSSGGFRVIRGEGFHARVREGAVEWAEAALEGSGTLHGAAGATPGGIRKEGRGTVFVVPAPQPTEEEDAGRWVVRHYFRGGMVARLLEDRYLRLGSPRPFREAGASETLRARGIRTPRVVAAAVYPAGLFTRGDVVTEFVPDAVELAELLFDVKAGGAPSDPASAPARRVAGLRAAGTLVRALGAAGVDHPDLNAKNILLRWTEAEIPRVYLIDLDRCRVGEPREDGSAAASKMYRRLCRSLRKIGSGDAALSPEEWKALADSFEG